MSAQGESHEEHDECVAVDFYRVVRASYTADQQYAMAVRAAWLFKKAAERGLIPWEYDGQRDDLMNQVKECTEWEWPDAPGWGEAA